MLVIKETLWKGGKFVASAHAQMHLSAQEWPTQLHVKRENTVNLLQAIACLYIYSTSCLRICVCGQYKLHNPFYIEVYMISCV